MIRLKICVVVLLSNLLCHNQTYCQGAEYLRSSFHSERKQVTLGTGISSFFGEVGGADKMGTHYLPIDLDGRSLRPTVFSSFKIPFPTPRWVYSVIFQYSLLRGNDALTDEETRRNRNINFRTHNFEISQHIEFNYYLRNRNRLQIKRDHKLYVFTGFTVLAFFPQGKYMDDWIALRPLNTEGQSLRGEEEYGTITYGIPLGLGFESRITGDWSFSVECSYTQSFSDYLDDTGGYYYDNEEIKSQYGDAAAHFADPSNGDKPKWSAPGAIRGNSKQKDGYAFINIAILRSVGR